jgi:predicted nucleic acid-binding protein
VQIVIDASTLVKWLTGNDISDEFKIQISRCEMLAPDLIINESLSVLKKLLIRKQITKSLFAEYVTDLNFYPHFLHSSRNLINSAIPTLGHISAYDSSYVCLAQELNIPFYTSDKRLFKVAKKYCKVVEV